MQVPGYQALGNDAWVAKSVPTWRWHGSCLLEVFHAQGAGRNPPFRVNNFLAPRAPSRNPVADDIVCQLGVGGKLGGHHDPAVFIHEVVKNLGAFFRLAVEHGKVLDALAFDDVGIFSIHSGQSVVKNVSGVNSFFTTRTVR